MLVLKPGLSFNPLARVTLAVGLTLPPCKQVLIPIWLLAFSYDNLITIRRVYTMMMIVKSVSIFIFNLSSVRISL